MVRVQDRVSDKVGCTIFVPIDLNSCILMNTLELIRSDALGGSSPQLLTPPLLSHPPSGMQLIWAQSTLFRLSVTRANAIAGTPHCGLLLHSQ